MRNKLRIIPLGGVGEIGKNMTVFEYGEDILIVDCGLIFPDEAMPGIDVVIPDMAGTCGYANIVFNNQRVLDTLKINFEGDPAECRCISGAVLLDVIRVDDIPNGDF